MLSWKYFELVVFSVLTTNEGINDGKVDSHMKNTCCSGDFVHPLILKSSPYVKFIYIVYI